MSIPKILESLPNFSNPKTEKALANLGDFEFKGEIPAENEL